MAGQEGRGYANLEEQLSPELSPAGRDGEGCPCRTPEVLVARGGIEPPTYRFSGGRSYQLSYLAVTADGRARDGRTRRVYRSLRAARAGLLERRRAQ